jgi:hypothetical protein
VGARGRSATRSGPGASARRPEQASSASKRERPPLGAAHGTSGAAAERARYGPPACSSMAMVARTSRCARAAGERRAAHAAPSPRRARARRRIRCEHGAVAGARAACRPRRRRLGRW